jgi:formate-dependent nitrite reductase membrane component NrfD
MNPFVADPDWGIWIILYFYLGGIAAGAYFLATLVALLGHEEDQAISRIGYRLALPLIASCGLFLTVDLERPERFWHMLLQSEIVERALAQGWPLGGWGTMLQSVMFKRWSPMSVGAWALMVFGLCSVLSVLGTLWPGGRLERWLLHGWFARILQVVGCLVGFFVGSYTGVLLTASNQPLWSLSDWIGPLFLASAASTGIATVLLLAQWSGSTTPATFARLERADLWALGLELFVFLIFLASLQGLLPLALTTGAGWILVLGTLVLGLLIPLWLHLRAGAHEPARMALASICGLVGGLALRVGVLKTAPALLDRLPALTGGEVPPPPWHVVSGIGLLVVAVALGIAVPWVLRRKWALSNGGTALAGLVSLLVCLGVIVYTVKPATGQPMLEAFAIPGFSYEDGRERGGGPGASVSNRPDPEELRLRSKVTGTLPDEP